MLNPIEEARFAELRDKCRELKVPSPPQIFIHLKVHDKNGILTFDDIQRGHSWTRNFWNAMWGFTSDQQGIGDSTFAAGKMSSGDTSSTISSSAGRTIMRGTNTYQTNTGYTNNTANATFGIVLGTGNTAFSVNHLTLATLIAHGNGSGQLNYQSMIGSISNYTTETKTWSNSLSRMFNNNSGSSITVKETGLYWYGGMYANSQLYFMFERSVLDPTVAVANGAQLTVTYAISMDFSAID